MRRKFFGNAVVTRAITLAMAFMVSVTTLLGSASVSVAAEMPAPTQLEITADTVEVALDRAEDEAQDVISEVVVSTVKVDEIIAKFEEEKAENHVENYEKIEEFVSSKVENKLDMVEEKLDDFNDMLDEEGSVEDVVESLDEEITTQIGNANVVLAKEDATAAEVETVITDLTAARNEASDAFFTTAGELAEAQAQLEAAQKKYDAAVAISEHGSEVALRELELAKKHMETAVKAAECAKAQVDFVDSLLAKAQDKLADWRKNSGVIFLESQQNMAAATLELDELTQTLAEDGQNTELQEALTQFQGAVTTLGNTIGNIGTSAGEVIVDEAQLYKMYIEYQFAKAAYDKAVEAAKKAGVEADKDTAESLEAAIADMKAAMDEAEAASAAATEAYSKYYSEQNVSYENALNAAKDELSSAAIALKELTKPEAEDEMTEEEQAAYEAALKDAQAAYDNAAADVALKVVERELAEEGQLVRLTEDGKIEVYVVNSLMTIDEEGNEIVEEVETIIATYAFETKAGENDVTVQLGHIETVTVNAAGYEIVTKDGKQYSIIPGKDGAPDQEIPIISFAGVVGKFTAGETVTTTPVEKITGALDINYSLLEDENGKYLLGAELGEILGVARKYYFKGYDENGNAILEATYTTKEFINWKLQDVVKTDIITRPVVTEYKIIIDGEEKNPTINLLFGINSGVYSIGLKNYVKVDGGYVELVTLETHEEEFFRKESGVDSNKYAADKNAAYEATFAYGNAVKAWEDANKKLEAYEKLAEQSDKFAEKDLGTLSNLPKTTLEAVTGVGGNLTDAITEAGNIVKVLSPIVSVAGTDWSNPTEIIDAIGTLGKALANEETMTAISRLLSSDVDLGEFVAAYIYSDDMAATLEQIEQNQIQKFLLEAVLKVIKIDSITELKSSATKSAYVHTWVDAQMAKANIAVNAALIIPELGAVGTTAGNLISVALGTNKPELVMAANAVQMDLAEATVAPLTVTCDMLGLSQMVLGYLQDQVASVKVETDEAYEAAKAAEMALKLLMKQGNIAEDEIAAAKKDLDDANARYEALAGKLEGLQDKVAVASGLIEDLEAKYAELIKTDDTVVNTTPVVTNDVLAAYVPTLLSLLEDEAPVARTTVAANVEAAEEVADEIVAIEDEQTPLAGDIAKAVTETVENNAINGSVKDANFGFAKYFGYLGALLALIIAAVTAYTVNKKKASK